MSDPANPKNPDPGIRLNRFLAMAGIGSRRVCDELIQKGLVKVNEEVQTEPATRVVEGRDKVEFHGKPVTLLHETHYYIFNKPRGVITTTQDPFGRPIVVDFLPGDARIYPVGRLDFDTTGALLLTNDGDVAYRLTHPKFQIPKIYQVLIRGNPPESTLHQVEAGIEIEAGFVARGEINGFRYQGGNTEVRLTLREGKKREVKRIFRTLGHPVVRLHRESFATLTVDGLKPGEWRELTPEEVRELKELVHGH
ncbi:MAG: rRNA pseudouridine synthase [Candidatus Marinimicrobia bacterium]|nr:rRNA pseudouridine synthase [Candidatus Neomarinimicrobiota bacterium]MCF7840309.1 rRNA pseudouridine synthase [Candidatus Neomarinimicrobiota bacterium]